LASRARRPLVAYHQAKKRNDYCARAREAGSIFGQDLSAATARSSIAFASVAAPDSCATANGTVNKSATIADTKVGIILLMAFFSLLAVLRI
jgi:hypothetical protein